jgi:hypothetical protein
MEEETERNIFATIDPGLYDLLWEDVDWEETHRVLRDLRKAGVKTGIMTSPTAILEGASIYAISRFYDDSGEVGHAFTQGEYAGYTAVVYVVVNTNRGFKIRFAAVSPEKV